MATATSQLPEAQAAISPFGRIVGVFFSPKSTFEDIVRAPSWALPVIISTVLSIAVSVGINQRINWREFMAQQIEKSSAAAQMSPEQKEQRIEGGAKFSPPFTYAIGACAPLLAVVIVALVLWGGYNLLGGADTSYKTSLAITSHAFLTGLISGLLFLLVLYLKPVGGVDLENPVATNIGALLPDDSAKWLVTLCKSLDIFSFWNMVLLAIGFTATNPKKLKGGKAYSIIFMIWGAYVVVRVGWAFIFS